MDRVVVFAGAIPQDIDLLNTNKNTMIGLGMAMQAILGTSTVVDGLACTPTSPAGMTVNVAPGSIYSQQNVDGTAYGSLAPDTTHQIVKQGISLGTTNLSCPAPGTVGQSVVYLVQVAYQDTDGGATVLPYYNSSNPAIAYNGPNNTGVSQNTVRQGVCLIAVKTGVAATTGTQVTPSPDAGYTGLFAVTVANGATTITSGNIVQLSTAPFISPKLPNFIPTVQAGASNYAQDTSVTANVITVALSPTPTLAAGFPMRVKIANTNSTAGTTVINTNGGGNVQVNDTGGNPIPPNTLKANSVYSFVHDGTYWELQSPTGTTANFGQCRLTKSGSNLLLSPYNGNKLVINGVPQTVPSAGITLSNSGYSNNTTYYIYAFMSSGVMTLEGSATAYATDTTTGVPIKSGDSTRTIVGMARINGSGAWTDTAAQRFVISYFNRRGIALAGASSSAGSTSSTSATLVELNTAARAEGLCWGDESVSGSMAGYASISSAGNAAAAVGVNGTTQINTAAVNTFPNSSTFLNASTTGTTSPSEGYFNLSGLGGNVTGGGTASYTYQIFGQLRG